MPSILELDDHETPCGHAADRARRRRTFSTPFLIHKDECPLFFSLLAANWTTRGTSNYGWVVFHQGGRFDLVTGLFAFRNRDFSPTLGRWVSQDELGMNGGGDNLYLFLLNNPVNWTDPQGQQPGLVNLFPRPGG